MAKTYSFDINSEKKIYRIKPPLARGSYMQSIIEPQAFSEGDDPEYNCQLRWPMDDPEVQEWVKDMGKLFRQIFTDHFGEKGAEMMKNPNIKIPLRNGNNEPNEELDGWLFMNVRNKFRQPLIIGPTGKALPADFINDEVIYSGAWYRSRINLRYYKHPKGGQGVGAYVEILMKIKDDDRLDSVISVEAAEDEFAGFAVDDAEAFNTAEKASDKMEGSDDDEFDFL